MYHPTAKRDEYEHNSQWYHRKHRQKSIKHLSHHIKRNSPDQYDIKKNDKLVLSGLSHIIGKKVQ
jgi:hypothetical protein